MPERQLLQLQEEDETLKAEGAAAKRDSAIGPWGVLRRLLASPRVRIGLVLTGVAIPLAGCSPVETRQIGATSVTWNKLATIPDALPCEPQTLTLSWTVDAGAASFRELVLKKLTPKSKKDPVRGELQGLTVLQNPPLGEGAVQVQFEFFNLHSGQEGPNHAGAAHLDLVLEVDVDGDGTPETPAAFGLIAHARRQEEASTEPPSISDLEILYASLPVPGDHERFQQVVSFEYVKPRADAIQVQRALIGPNDQVSSIDTFDLCRPRGENDYRETISIDSSYVPGPYQIEFELLDDQGRSSGVASASFSIDPNAPPPLAIHTIDPPSGRAGDTVVIFGAGFSEEPSANEVFFERTLYPVEVLSAAYDELHVVVPQAAISGSVAVTTDAGRVLSPTPFTIEPTVSLEPQATRLVVGQGISFACTPSGTDSLEIEWSIPGQAPGDTTLGTIDEGGRYTAPAALPPVNPVTVQCAHAEDPLLVAEALAEVVGPVSATPGTATIPAAEGGEVISAQGDARIVVPAHALAEDTTLAIAAASPDALPHPPGLVSNEAAVELLPSGLVLTAAASVEAPLRSFEDPGTLLPVFLVDEGTSSLVETGQTAAVDDTGLKAIFEVDHFSKWVIGGHLDKPFADLDGELAEIVSGGDVSLSLGMPPELPLLEGLSVPVLVSLDPVHGKARGPFVTGLSARTDLPAPVGFLTAGPIVQPSPDGWQVGTTINVPVLPDCAEGEFLPANLELSFAQHGPHAAVLRIELPPVECLDELELPSNPPVGDGRTLRVIRGGAPGGGLLVQIVGPRVPVLARRRGQRSTAFHRARPGPSG
jgi:hypothetical protein